MESSCATSSEPCATLPQHVYCPISPNHQLDSHKKIETIWPTTSSSTDHTEPITLRKPENCIVAARWIASSGLDSSPTVAWQADRNANSGFCQWVRMMSLIVRGPSRIAKEDSNGWFRSMACQ